MRAPEETGRASGAPDIDLGTRDDLIARRSGRTRRTTAAALGGLGSRLVAVLVSLVSIPLTVGYLGQERYGVWITLGTLTAWLTVADLGLGNALTTRVAEAYGARRPETARAVIATTFWVLVVVAACLAVVAALAWVSVDWGAFFKVTTLSARAEVGGAVALALAFFVLGFPSAVVPRILLAYQRGAIANGWQALGSIASLVALVLVIQTRGGLPWLVAALAGAPVAVSLASAIWLFRSQPELSPAPRYYDRATLRSVGSTGLRFFIIQIAALVLFQSDNLVIAGALGAKEVSGYSIAYRLFGYLVIMQGLVLTPLWPAFTEAAAAKDMDWVRRVFQRALSASLGLGVPAVIALMIGSRWLIQKWTGQSFDLPTSVIVLVALWTLMSIFGNVYATLMNALDHTTFQAAGGIIMATLNLVLSIMWVRTYGVAGVIAGTVVAYGLVSVISQPLYTHYIIFRRHAKG